VVLITLSFVFLIYLFTVNENLYSWGYNAHRQLCLGNNTDQNKPVKVDSDSFDGKDIKQLVSGDRHCIALTSIYFI